MNGIRIRKLMQQRGLKIVDVAKIVGVNHSHISNIIAGRKKPSIDLALKLSRVFGVSVNELACMGKGTAPREQHEREMRPKRDDDPQE